jgi:integral membrane sensor domain MASE1
VSAVWPPTGVAIAAVLLLGLRIWPAILLGAFLANLLTPVPVAAAAGIAIGNTLEALSAGLLLRYLDFHNSFDRARDVFKFTLLASLCTMVSASVGTLSLCLGHAAVWQDFGSLWMTWWLGDTVGALVVAPVLLTWSTESRPWSNKRYLEAALLLTLLAVLKRRVMVRTKGLRSP